MKLFSRSTTFDSKGGTLDAPRHGARVTVPAGALTRPTVLRLEVTAGASPLLPRLGGRESPEQFTLTLDAGALAANASIELRLPLAGAFDPASTAMVARSGHGMLMALPAAADPATSHLTGTLTKATVAALAAGTFPGTGARAVLTFVTAHLAPVAATPLVVGVYQSLGGAWTPLAATSLTGKKVALLVHGIDASLTDLDALADFVLGYVAPGQSQPRYDLVIGFQYSSNAPLATLGSLAAEALRPLLSTATSADAFAHSLGNLILRYAMETASPHRIGAYVQNYFSLGGPHQGVPFASPPYFQALQMLFGAESLPCLRDLVTHGRGGPPLTAFLTNLDTLGPGPDRLTAHYFTMSGNDWPDLWVGPVWVGSIFETMYTLAVGPDTIQDGVLANYSAQSDVLAQQSKAWSPNAPLRLSHTQLVTADLAFDTLRSWLNTV
jgi:hypothetical protein